MNMERKMLRSEPTYPCRETRDTNIPRVSTRPLFCSSASKLLLNDRPHLAAGWDPGPRDGFSRNEITEMISFSPVSSTCAVERWSCAQP